MASKGKGLAWSYDCFPYYNSGLTQTRRRHIHVCIREPIANLTRRLWEELSAIVSLYCTHINIKMHFIHIAQISES